MHALAVDDGTHSPGGIPVFHAASIFGTSSLKGGPYTQGPYPSTAGVTVQQYGLVRVVDTGAEMSLEFTGYQAGGIAKMAYTKTYAV